MQLGLCWKANDGILRLKTVSFMRILLLIVATVLIVSSCLAQAHDPEPRVLLRQMYLATGGDNWRHVEGAAISGKYIMGGLEGSFHKLVDFQKGRDVLMYEVGVTSGKQGTQQGESWLRDEKGLVTMQNAPDALADAATQSYEDRNGWFYPLPNDNPKYLGAKHEGGRLFNLIQVHPPGGRRLTLWIDSATHRLDRAVVMDANQREATTYFSDYHKVNGIFFPFLQRSSMGDPGSDVIMSITQIHIQPHMEDRDFAPPPPPVTPDFHFVPGESRTIPFTLKGGMIVVNVSIENKPALPFVLDSGALNVLTPEAAKALNLTADGNLSTDGVGNNQVSTRLARIKNFRVGPAELLDQRFVIVSLPLTFVNNGKDHPIAGLLGYELFRRFVVKIDYHRRELTLWSPLEEHGGKLGAKVPLMFNGRDCFITAFVDGAPGVFGIDTGDDGALTLFGTYYTAHHFPIEVPGIKSFQGGVGGNAPTLLTRVNTLSIGPFTLSRPLAELHFATGGAFSSRLVAGNLGAQVFRNFIMTFDYEHSALYIEKSQDFEYQAPYNRTGIHLDLNDAGDILVVGVNKGSPGDLAGVQSNDQVLAINDHPVRGELYSSVEEQLSGPAGSHLTLDLLRGGKKARLTLTLQELLPSKGPFTTKVTGINE